MLGRFSPSRTVAAVTVAALLLAGLLLGGRPSLLASLGSASGSLLRSPGDAERAPWFHLRLLHDHIVYTAGHGAPTPPAVHAAAGLLVDVDTHRILWEQDAHAQLPPASTVKVLTALVTLENFPPTQAVTVTAGALDQGWDESTMGLRAGETLTVEELLTGMLLVSANDAATVLAQDTVGRERFVAAMNAQIAALGLHDSHVTTPVGLSDPRMYASAYDLAVISAATMQAFPLFDRLVDMQDATLAASSHHQAYQLRTVDQLLSMYPAAIGVKPGWTSEAGPCEVGMAVRGGHRLLSVLLDAPLDFTQSRALLDWGFTHEGLPSELPPPSPRPSAAVALASGR